MFENNSFTVLSKIINSRFI